MGTFEIVSIILGVVLVLVIVMFAFINRKYTKLLRGMKEREVDDVNIKKGVRYTIDQTVVDEEGNMNVSFGQGDIVLKPRKTVKVGKDGDIKAGKYTILATHDDEDKFNIRVSGYVKEYKHNEEIVLADGDEVTAVSTTVILR